MTVITPPLYLNVGGEYGAADLGLPLRDLVAEGVLEAGDLEVSERGAGANMSVDVAAGVAWIRGDSSATLQPAYRCLNDGTVNLAIAEADDTDDRLDLIVAEVRDSVFAGVSDDWQLRVVEGTPAGSPALPALPDSAIPLAQVSVPASATTVEDADITDLRPRAGLAGGLLGVPLVTDLPTAPYDGQVIDYLADSSAGIVWRLRYREAEAGSYKWYFLGGPPVSAEVAASQSSSSSSYADLSTVGPAIALPLAGDYNIELGAGSAWHGNSGQAFWMSYAIGGTAAQDVDGIFMQDQSAPTVASRYRAKRKTGLAAVTLTAKYKSASGAGTWQDRFIRATPIRVG